MKEKEKLRKASKLQRKKERDREAFGPDLSTKVATAEPQFILAALSR